MSTDREAVVSGTASPASDSGAQMMLRAILESASQAIVTADQRGIILSANPRTEGLFGYSASELIGSPVEKLLPHRLRTEHVQHRSRFHANPHVRPMGLGMDLVALRKDGREFPVEVSLSYVQLPQGMVGIAFISDITERKRLEEQLIQSQKMEAVGRLAGGIAHDFNNLLTIISGYDRMLLDALSPLDPVRGYAEEIVKAADRATALTKQLLAFSRRQIVQPRIVNLNDILADASKMLRRLIGEHIELTVLPAADLGNVRADPGQLEQVIFNLVANARDALDHDGARITVETHNADLSDGYAHMHLGVKPGRYVMLAVTDNGKGMDAETKRHIFEPFFTTKPTNQGTGLGLATVYGIVKQNEGDIWVYSELGQGTTFKVYLPQVMEHVEPSIDDGGDKRARGGSETILVVEDDEGVRQLVVDLLTRHGYSVLTAGDGVQALEQVARHPGKIDLVLTDVVMPRMSGAHLASEMERLHPGVQVVYMSGYTENTVGTHNVLDSDVFFIQKPFQFDALLAKLREALAKGS